MKKAAGILTIKQHVILVQEVTVFGKVLQIQVGVRRNLAGVIMITIPVKVRVVLGILPGVIVNRV